ncbi:MAG TPA: HAD hydrolase-like protein [Bacillota bacterium]|jgi:HAD superfamily phosphatase (TIGR01668 family)|nr:HAD hydrolase-like protein [Fastidiosipila sp.]HPX92943.1 HAD hydrolase-like protein [Bacillota bacterium]HQB80757.1 HAD hydrolase-like protein [Bacillota bacterium]
MLVDNKSKEKEQSPERGLTLSCRIRSLFFPDLIVGSPLAIDFARLVSWGFRLALVDIDNTLVRHGSQAGDDHAVRVIRRMQDAGLTPVVASNAPRKRARAFADSLGIEFIAKAKKPQIEAICLALEERACLPQHTIMIGDQLLTDVWSARKAGIPVILTDRRSRQEIITVRLKRPLEWLLIRLGGKTRWHALRENYTGLAPEES